MSAKVIAIDITGNPGTPPVVSVLVFTGSVVSGL